MKTKMNDHKSNDKIIQLNLSELIVYVSIFVSPINSKFPDVVSFVLKLYLHTFISHDMILHDIEHNVMPDDTMIKNYC